MSSRPASQGPQTSLHNDVLLVPDTPRLVRKLRIPESRNLSVDPKTEMLPNGSCTKVQFELRIAPDQIGRGRFAYTGLGPRDFVEGSVDTALGGNEFVTSSIELRIATPNPNITVAGFADAGALWGLDDVTGGASGTIDDSYFLRTSVDMSIYWDSALGLLQLNVAKPIDKRDTDQEERVSLNLNFQF